MSEKAAPKRKQATDPVTALKLFNHCVSKFGFAVIACEIPMEDGRPIFNLWGEYVEDAYMIKSRATRKDWIRQAEWANTRWPGFLTPENINQKEFKYFQKVVKS